MPLSDSIRFKSERFDYKSDLPANFNAGNRFYGKDVAEHITDSLKSSGIRAEYLDEDWGWLILSARGEAHEFEVAVYNLAEHGEGGRPGVPEWGLWVRSYERTKLLGFIPKKVEVKVGSPLRLAITKAIRQVGAEPEPWPEGPSGA